MLQASVTVVIPCYCCSGTIRRAVESIVQQKLRPAKVILVDDASIDNTLEILQDLQKEYGENWIQIIEVQSNQGPSYARNIAWDQAKEDYIAFLDSDNAWHSDKIEIQYNWMVKNSNVDICGHIKPSVIDNQNFIQSKVKIQKSFTAYLINKNKILISNPFETSSVMLKRNIKFRFDLSKRYCEDYLLWMKICLEGHSTYLLDLNFVYIYNQPKSLSSNKLAMRMGDIANYINLCREDYINIFQAAGLIAYSFFKFFMMLLFPKFHIWLRQKISYKN